MATTIVRLNWAFWLFIIFLVIMGVLLAVLGPSRLKSVIEGGFSDAFRR